MSFDGILLVDKPKGWTSHDVVAKIRNYLKKQAGCKVKVGHTGTLDPLATGLMILAIGQYTKRAQEFSKLDKTYQVSMRLGQTSSTGDSEGEIVATSSVVADGGEVENTFKSFIGESMQQPPAYSALKINGQRAYKLARAGKQITLEPRKMTIYDISKINYQYPDISFMVSVSSGTYIRSLVEDIGDKLKTGAYMSQLRRTQVGDFTIGRACKIENSALHKLIEEV